MANRAADPGKLRVFKIGKLGASTIESMMVIEIVESDNLQFR
jgi:hypothetical protein